MTQIPDRSFRCTSPHGRGESYRHTIDRTLNVYRDRIEDNHYNRKYILNKRGLLELLNMKRPNALQFNLKCYPADQTELDSNHEGYKQKYQTFWQNLHNQVKMAEFLNKRIEKIVHRKMVETKTFNLRGVNLSKLRMLSSERKQYDEYQKIRCLSYSPKRRIKEGLTLLPKPRKIPKQNKFLSSQR